ncbi:hypothetical protein BDZ91DRAFT_794620 [Kalaharituber pfeilii]|nr:hypothetical protein BDZ91DRAFT_794620 [Kalaharituber pfeilii]
MLGNDPTATSMANGSLQIDWENDLCWLTAHSIAVQNHTMYVMGGHMALVPEKQSLLDHKEMGNRHLRILDFSRSFDLSRDKITKAIGMDRDVPVLWRPHLLANTNGLYQFGSGAAVSEFFNDTGHRLPREERPPPANTKMYMFDLDRNEWGAPWESGLGEETPIDGMVAVDQAGEVGWVYGGFNYYQNIPPLGLVRFDMHGKEKPVGEIVKTVNREVMPELWGGELVFLRGLGKEGMLILIGGKASLDGTTLSLDTINVYDIASRTWFKQESSPADNSSSIPGGPHRSGYCAVGASARDNSSHNIYMYAGITWMVPSREPDFQMMGDMWILSLPSFTWIGPVAMGSVGVIGGSTKLDQHRCTVMQNRYMVVYQGRDWDAPTGCNPQNGVRLFDLQTMEWTTRYEFSEDPEPYRVPKVVYDVIGGDDNGGATLTVPKAPVNPTLKDILARQTDTNGTPTGTLTGTPEPLPSSAPEPHSDPGSYVCMLVGSTLGGLIIGGTLILLVVYLRRCRKRRARAATSGVESHAKPELEAVVPKELGAQGVQAPVGYHYPVQGIAPDNFEPVELPDGNSPRVHHELFGCETPPHSHGSKVASD